ncbi:unnamed protein product [Amoebophrya sp. A25]|nr:unnamed protein product [Amoebophrya sp. A25]|eukprot:GSA25T00003162001.1
MTCLSTAMKFYLWGFCPFPVHFAGAIKMREMRRAVGWTRDVNRDQLNSGMDRPLVDETESADPYILSELQRNFGLEPEEILRVQRSEASSEVKSLPADQVCAEIKEAEEDPQTPDKLKNRVSRHMDQLFQNFYPGVNLQDIIRQGGASSGLLEKHLARDVALSMQVALARGLCAASRAKGHTATISDAFGNMLAETQKKLQRFNDHAHARQKTAVVVRGPLDENFIVDLLWVVSWLWRLALTSDYVWGGYATQATRKWFGLKKTKTEDLRVAVFPEGSLESKDSTRIPRSAEQTLHVKLKNAERTARQAIADEPLPDQDATIASGSGSVLDVAAGSASAGGTGSSHPVAGSGSLVGISHTLKEWFLRKELVLPFFDFDDTVTCSNAHPFCTGVAGRDQSLKDTGLHEVLYPNLGLLEKFLLVRSGLSTHVDKKDKANSARRAAVLYYVGEAQLSSEDEFAELHLSLGSGTTPPRFSLGSGGQSSQPSQISVPHHLGWSNLLTARPSSTIDRTKAPASLFQQYRSDLLPGAQNHVPLAILPGTPLPHGAAAVAYGLHTAAKSLTDLPDARDLVSPQGSAWSPSALQAVATVKTRKTNGFRQFVALLPELKGKSAFDLDIHIQGDELGAKMNQLVEVPGHLVFVGDMGQGNPFAGMEMLMEGLAKFVAIKRVWRTWKGRFYSMDPVGWTSRQFSDYATLYTRNEEGSPVIEQVHPGRVRGSTTVDSDAAAAQTVKNLRLVQARFLIYDHIAPLSPRVPAVWNLYNDAFKASVLEKQFGSKLTDAYAATWWRHQKTGTGKASFFYERVCTTASGHRLLCRVKEQQPKGDEHPLQALGQAVLVHLQQTSTSPPFVRVPTCLELTKWDNLELLRTPESDEKPLLLPTLLSQLIAGGALPRAAREEMSFASATLQKEDKNNWVQTDVCTSESEAGDGKEPGFDDYKLSRYMLTTTPGTEAKNKKVFAYYDLSVPTRIKQGSDGDATKIIVAVNVIRFPMSPELQSLDDGGSSTGSADYAASQVGIDVTQ